jgi:hypothetical protein
MSCVFGEASLWIVINLCRFRRNDQEDGSGLDDRIYRLSQFMKILLVKKNRLPTVRPRPHFLTVFIYFYQIERIEVSFESKEFFQVI